MPAEEKYCDCTFTYADMVRTCFKRMEMVCNHHRDQINAFSIWGLQNFFLDIFCFSAQPSLWRRLQKVNFNLKLLLGLVSERKYC